MPYLLYQYVLEKLSEYNRFDSNISSRYNLSPSQDPSSTQGIIYAPTHLPDGSLTGSEHNYNNRQRKQNASLILEFGRL